MAQYLLKRILWGLVTLWGVTLIAFSLVHLIPGDPAVVMAGPAARPEDVAAIRARLKLDQPLPVQYATYVGNLLRGDLGESLYSHAPVSQLIAERLPDLITLRVRLRHRPGAHFSRHGKCHATFGRAIFSALPR